MNTTLDEYLAAINGKTAALIRTSCELGARCSGLDEIGIAALTRLGEMFGTVFQLVDDLMDIISTERLWRKPVKQDLANGVYTACVITELRNRDSELHQLLSQTMDAEAIDRANHCAATGGVRETLDLLDHHLQCAETALETLTRSTGSTRLTALPRRYATGVLESLWRPNTAAWPADFSARRPSPHERASPWLLNAPRGGTIPVDFNLRVCSTRLTGTSPSSATGTVLSTAREN